MLPGDFNRRHLLKLGGAALLAGTPIVAGSGAAAADRSRGGSPQPAAPGAAEPADHTIRIATGLVELGSDAVVSTKLYNGQFPGPLLRLTEGKPVVVDVYNDTDTPELLHWHGQFVPAEVDGAAEEGTPFIPAHGMRRIAFTPGPSGFRLYHSHVAAGLDLSAGLYSGQVGPIFIEPRHDLGDYDREVFVTLKEFGPYLSRMDPGANMLAPTNRNAELREKSPRLLPENLSVPEGYELSFAFNSINGHMLGHGEPIRVKEGERLLLHVLNASAGSIRNLVLPAHDFGVVALDGNPVPYPSSVPMLWIAPAERISAIVEMTQPGVWLMGDLIDEDRKRGMGIVIEYAGRKGAPEWQRPRPYLWDYRRFAIPNTSVPPPDETIEMLFGVRLAARDGFDEYTINGVPFSMARMEPIFRLVRGRRYRIHMRNGTEDVHPVHLHRHSFEISNIAGYPTAGVIKDVAMIGAFQEMSIDFTADQPGLSLFHCHMQQHMDFGFMALFDCRDA